MTGFTPKAVLLAILLASVCAIWVVASEIVTATCLVGEAVPSIPAIGVLLALVVLRPVVNRLGRWASLSRREVLLIYVVVTITTPLASYGGFQFFFLNLSGVYYAATPENQFSSFHEEIPAWLAPREASVYVEMHEGVWEDRPGESAASGWQRDLSLIPWRAWRRPLAWWSVLFLALFGAAQLLLLLV